MIETMKKLSPCSGIRCIEEVSCSICRDSRNKTSGPYLRDRSPRWRWTVHRPFLNSSRRRPIAVGPVIPGGRSARTGTTPRPSHRSTRIHPDPRLLPSPIPPSIAECCFSSFFLLPFLSFRSSFPSNPSPFSKSCSLASSFPPFFLIIPLFLFVSLFAGTSHFTDNFPQFFGTFFFFFFFPLLLLW